jgi:YggT family protein
MFFILRLIYQLLQIYSLIVILGAILSWLVAFGVINTYNDMARRIIGVVARLTEPVYNQIRKVIPPLGGLDLSPLILLIGIWLIETVFLEPMMARAFSY